MKKIWDISWPLTQDMTQYKDVKRICISPLKQFEHDGVREYLCTFSNHTGTHIDAPAHFIEDGPTIDQIPLNMFNGSCQVIDLTSCQERITQSDLENVYIDNNKIILLKTRNSLFGPTDSFNYSWVFLDATGAEYLAQRTTKAVGIDYLGIERGQKDHETHRAFLARGLPIIEGLRLASVDTGYYELVCLPLAFKGICAAPARALLRSAS